jgi:hypothetical protein
MVVAMNYQSGKDGLTICLVGMVRNEADIIPTFLDCAARLFDRILLVDHQSTDGTRQIIDRFATKHSHLKVFDYRYRSHYQSDIFNMLTRIAFREGADWVFYLDADEFIDVENRAIFDQTIHCFPYDVMSLRWINLIPTEFGTFTSFNRSQQFHWSGRFSTYSKVAVSAQYAAQHPHFHIHHGKHFVSPSVNNPPEPMHDGCNILHVPIRSLERLRYKVTQGIDAYRTKRDPGAGFHWFELYERLNCGDVSADWLKGVIAQYGEPLSAIQASDPVEEASGVKYLPVGPTIDTWAAFGASLADTIDADTRIKWTEAQLGANSLGCPEIKQGEILLTPQAVALKDAIATRRYPLLRRFWGKLTLWARQAMHQIRS